MDSFITTSWPDYQLLDSGDGLRLERFGSFTTVRPDPNILWSKTDRHNPLWHKPDLLFLGKAQESGWQSNDPILLQGWPLHFGKAVFKVKPTPFRHVGLFPEQATNWQWLEKLIAAQTKSVRVLNLFAYTGAASIIAARAGAEVCHVDASAGSIQWAKENVSLSGLASDAIRWIQDDVPKFMKREIRRGKTYDIIIMDPPVFGRGPKGEIWRLEEHIKEVAESTAQLFSETPRGLLVNFYATALYPEAILYLFQQKLTKVALPPFQLASLLLQEESSKNGFPSGFCLRS